jgi:hypothetical protein
MSNNVSQRRSELFDQYATNLGLVKASKCFYIEPDLSDTILCPVCFRLFQRCDLNKPQTLTLDHVPPATFGGKDSEGVLLCGACNHFFGSRVDAQLKNTLDAIGLTSGIPGAETDARLFVDGILGIDVTIKLAAQDAFQIMIDQKRVNPKRMVELNEKLDSMKIKDYFSGSIRIRGGKERPTKIGFLRIAYLLLFKLFGYGAILFPSYNPIRLQILNPDDEVLSPNWLVPNAVAARMPLGISFISDPQNLRSYLAVFELTTGGQTAKYAVQLPTQNQDAEVFYQSLVRSVAPTSDDRTFSAMCIDVDQNFWHNPNAIFESYILANH